MGRRPVFWRRLRRGVQGRQEARPRYQGGEGVCSVCLGLWGGRRDRSYESVAAALFGCGRADPLPTPLPCCGAGARMRVWAAAAAHNRWQLSKVYCFKKMLQAQPDSSASSLAACLLAWSGCQQKQNFSQLTIAIIQRENSRRILNIDVVRVANSTSGLTSVSVLRK